MGPGSSAGREVYGGVEDPRALRYPSKEKMSLHPLCVKSIRTGVASWGLGKSDLREKLGRSTRIVVCGRTNIPLVPRTLRTLCALVGERLEAERTVAAQARLR